MSEPTGDRSTAPKRGQWRRLLPAPASLLIERFQHLLHEFGKFGLVGGVCFGIDTVIFNYFYLAQHLNKWPSLAISTAISTTIAFVGNRLWTWRGSERSALHREYGLYIAFNIIGIAITAATMAASGEWLGRYWSFLLSPLAVNLSKILGVGLASAFRFWSYRTYVFQRPTPAPAKTTLRPQTDVGGGSLLVPAVTPSE